MPDFQLKVYQNQYLTQGSGEVHAIVSVVAADDAHPGEAPRPAPAAPGTPAAPGSGSPALAFGLLIDRSGSMGENYGERIHRAKEASQQAVRMLRPENWFFVVAGADDGTVVHPLSRADPAAKAQAIAALGRLYALGGTCMSNWLREARAQFPAGPDFVRHALLLTDGKNSPGDETLFHEELARCEGAFQCDARGVGTDWQVAQLRQLTDRLLGTVDIIPDPAGIAADFTAILDQAMGRAVSEVSLRLWTPVGAEVKFLKQVAPEIVDLTPKARPDAANPGQLRDYPTGAWGREARDYHLCLRVPPGQVGQTVLAGRLSVLVGAGAAGAKVAEAKVLAVWTDDEAQSAVIDRQVAHYTGQNELAEAIQEGLAARQAGQEELATRRLGRAVQLAAGLGNEQTTRLLRQVVDVVDEKEGTVRLRRQVNEADAMALDTRSTRTRRLG